MTGIERIENLLDGAIPTLSSLPVQIFVEENFLPALFPSYFHYSRSPPDKSKIE